MATTTHRKISRKDLKRPDEFITFVDWVGDFFAENLTRMIIGGVIVIAVAVAAFSIYFYSQHQARMAAENFYQAMHALDHKDYKAAEQGFSGLANQRHGSTLGRLAQFYLASAYMDNNQQAKARDALEAYVQDNDQPLFRQMALTQLGVAYEELGDYRKAHDAYLRAATMEGPQKAMAELGVARTLVKQGEKTEAIAAYQQFLKENPFSRERDSVVEALANLGVAPSTATARPKVVAIPPTGAGDMRNAARAATGGVSAASKSASAPSQPAANSQ